MAKLLTAFILQLLFGIFRLCVLQRTSAGPRSVHPGGNITLHCDITVELEISWYHQSSEEMKLLITAIKGKLSKSFSLYYNLNEDHYDEIIDLVVVGVSETDLGLYYCGGRNDTNHIQFGKAIRLNFTGGDLQSNSSSAQTDSESSSPDPAPYQIIIVVLASVCLLSVLLNLIFSWVFCYRVQGENFLIDLIQNQLYYIMLCYDEILGPAVRPYAGAVGPGFLLVHNNARPHVGRLCRQFLVNEGIDTIDWPTGSPDLNPIEHLWDIMFWSIRRHQVALQTVQELSDALVQIWEEIPQDTIHCLIRSMWGPYCMAQ
ncbi:hypothetical protein NFI96_027468, partial [Prochilodus magdalenae]